MFSNNIVTSTVGLSLKVKKLLLKINYLAKKMAEFFRIATEDEFHYISGYVRMMVSQFHILQQALKIKINGFATRVAKQMRAVCPLHCISLGTKGL